MRRVVLAALLGLNIARDRGWSAPPVPTREDPDD